MGRLASATVLSLLVCSLSAGVAIGAEGEQPQPAEPPTASMEEVAISGPKDLARLERLGLDVTHDVSEDSATVALYSEADRALLDREGFSSRTLIRDLAAKSSAERLAEASVAVPTALPSGRTTYRVYDDYLAEIDQLADQNPDFVRKVVVGQSLEGREIVGLEIASEVNREDDGRPVYVQMGLHHVREWPSGEFPMEFAIDLVNGYNDPDSNQRIVDLVENARTFILPVINPDGFLVSRGAAISPVGGGGAIGFGIVAGSGEYKRKNCRPANAAEAAIPCAQRPASSGVDLNRNYGYYWGGPGSSTTASSESYRGAAPFSEPESEAMHRFVSKIHPTVLISNHTFTENGWWLRQPGFNGSFFPQDNGATTPDEEAMKALGDAMGDEGMDNPLLGATGWPSDRAWELGDITGATEDWNYFAQGTYGYTPEARGTDFHGLYQAMVINEYTRDPAEPDKGVREAFLLAGEEAYDVDNHGVIEGSVPPGATLTLHKEFDAPRHPQNGGPPTHEVLHTTLEGGADGNYRWHVMPDDRPKIPDSPLPAGDETWTMTCQRPGGPVGAAVQVEVARNETVIQDWAAADACGPPPVDPNEPPVADFDFTPDAPQVGEQVNFVSTSEDPDGAIDPSQTTWDLDNDEQFDDASGLTATHTFDGPGPHDVSIQVTDNENASDVETKTIQVSPVANQPPAAEFTIFPSNPGVGEDVTFTSTSTDSDGTVVSHEWDLDADGGFDDAQGSQVTRAFTVAGTYTISLRASDDDGASGVRTRQLTVGVTPAALRPVPLSPPSTQAGSGVRGVDHCQRLRNRLKKAKSKKRKRKIRRNMGKRDCRKSGRKRKRK
ncbi:MAG: M14 family zinc carboxypeptidase [Solirubrobacterales bacterium]